MCFAIKKRRREPGKDVKILSVRLLRIKNSAEHSSCTHVDRPSPSVDEQFNYTTMRRTENVFEKRRLPASACLFPLESGVALSRTVFEDDASTISQPPTTHYTNNCVKLTIVTHLSFSERIAIANLSFYISDFTIITYKANVFVL